MNLTRQSVRTDAASTYSAPVSSFHGKQSWRRFASRHVPDVAEDLAASPTLAPEIVTRFNGLMRHLKNNSDREEQAKQVMVSQVETLVPEEYDEALRGEFERQCCYGDRENTEQMSSSKWMKLLKSCGAVVLLEADKRDLPPGQGAVTQAEADVIFLKVLHACDYGGKKFNYELFCKGLYLLAQAVAPDLDGEQAFSELIQRIIATAPEDPQRLQDTPDPMLDANVLLVLDSFKPVLLELFQNYCGRNLANTSQGNHGMGTVRLSERTVWKHTTQSALNSSWGAGRTFGSTLGLNDTLTGSKPLSDRAQNHAGSQSVPLETPEEVVENGELAAATPARASGEVATSTPARESGELGTSSAALPAYASSCHESVVEPYQYANGAPVPRDRLRNISLDQFLIMSRELKIIPDLLGKVEIVNIFKKAQLSGSASQHGSTAHGYLSAEAFVDAVGQMALDSYSKQPYSDEYPEPHERINAFFTLVLPCSPSLKKNERVAYGLPPRQK